MPTSALEGCLEQLAAAIDAARRLGLPTADAEAILADARGRLGFPSDAYVLALVGGTGVGKSTLLNGLAGEAVSTASVRRPTTGRPVAWIPTGSRDALDGLLDWLGVGEVVEHAGLDGDGTGAGDDPLPSVAVLDLPDIDSLEPAHRARVEEILPRVDAVAWVTDPEKYADAVLHDEFLRSWLGRLGRQVVILNKTDRLVDHDADRVVADLRRDTARIAGRSSTPDVLVTAARDGRVDAVRRWLAAGTEAKRVVRARLAASVVAAAEALAVAGGVDQTARAQPILDPAARRSAIAWATESVLRVVDLDTARSQAVAATRARARRRGTGPIGWLTATIYRLSGAERRSADPRRYLARWRDRGSLAPAVEPIRDALGEPLRTAAPGTRAVLADAVEPRRLDAALAGALDRVIAATPATPPSSRLWPLIGGLQSAVTMVLVAAVAWLVFVVVVRPPTDVVEVPVLGPVPVPLVLLVGALVAGYLLARLLGLHAGWLGRRWARRLADRLHGAIDEAVGTTAFAALEPVEAARRSLWAAVRSIDEHCR
ncbi:MAG TPA: GTPase [Candidatus Limnocylindrales bacterium]|nr:GTPase [Candidatus Limnocylindrales bacterium]